jgi:hypothetical protein
MNVNYLFIIISFIIGFFLIDYLRSFDLHEKEPRLKMIVVSLWGGIWSIGISLESTEFSFTPSPFFVNFHAKF